MKKLLPLLAALSFVCAPATASADIHTDDLSRCLLNATTNDDKLALMRWLFVQMAFHPVVADIARTTPESILSVDTRMARLFERLIAVDCRSQSIQAVKYGGNDPFGPSFEVLGKVAMTELMADDKVNAGLAGFTQHLNEAAFDGIFSKPATAP
jgi:hypothetical protein